MSRAREYLSKVGKLDESVVAEVSRTADALDLTTYQHSLRHWGGYQLEELKDIVRRGELMEQVKGLPEFKALSEAANAFTRAVAGLRSKVDKLTEGGK